VPAIDPEAGAMKRHWNLTIWIGFLIVLAAPFIYLSVFLRYPALRDAPWTTLAIPALGIGLMVRGVRRAWRRPEAYRGRIAGSILLSLGVACVALFAFEIFYRARQLPASQGAPRVGEKASRSRTRRGMPSRWRRFSRPAQAARAARTEWS
jgi:hypothetical protein